MAGKTIYLGGVPKNTTKSSSGGLAPSGAKALSPSGVTVNRVVPSVRSIPAASPKAASRPNVHPTQRP
jgi:hypothetical protein